MQAENSLEFEMMLALKGDSAAYSRVLKEITRKLQSYLQRKINRPEDLEDIIQEILVSFHKARHTYDGKRPLLPFVYAIAKFRFHDYLRKNYSILERGRAELTEIEDFAATNVTESRSDNEYIKKEVSKLKSKQAKIIELMHYEGYTAKETAVKLGMKESAVKVAAHRAYKILKTRLGKR